MAVPSGTTPVPIIVQIAKIESLKADFVKREVKFVVSVNFNDEFDIIRERLTQLATDPEYNPVEVRIIPLQAKLNL